MGNSNNVDATTTSDNASPCTVEYLKSKVEKGSAANAYSLAVLHEGKHKKFEFDTKGVVPVDFALERIQGWCFPVDPSDYCADDASEAEKEGFNAFIAKAACEFDSGYFDDFGMSDIDPFEAAEQYIQQIIDEIESKFEQLEKFGFDRYTVVDVDPDAYYYAEDAVKALDATEHASEAIELGIVSLSDELYAGGLQSAVSAVVEVCKHFDQYSASSLKARFRLLREQVGASQADLAEAVNVKADTVKKWEKPGAAMPPQDAWDVLEEWNLELENAYCDVMNDVENGYYSDEPLMLKMFRNQDEYASYNGEKLFAKYWMANALARSIDLGARWFDANVKMAYSYPADLKRIKAEIA